MRYSFVSAVLQPRRRHSWPFPNPVRLYQAVKHSSCRQHRHASGKVKTAAVTSPPAQAQVFPLSGFYKILLDYPQPPSEHPAYYPKKLADRAPNEEETVLEQQLEDRARLVFGSRLVGPMRKDKSQEGFKTVAGIRVPPKPAEPDNCCMSGCVNCVWDTFREDLEQWAMANTQANEALRKLNPGAPSSVGKRAELQGAQVVEDGSMSIDGGNLKVDVDIWEGLDEIPIGIRVFMETEKNIRSRHT